MPTGFGSFCWQQLNTTDLAAAEAFYSKLFGWQVQREAMGRFGPFALVKNAGQEIGTLMQLPADAESQSHWLSYVWVENLDASFEKMLALGGQAFVPPTAIPGVGRFAVFADPGGALLALFEQLPPVDPAKPAPTGPGTFCWFECTTREDVACIAFYTALFGWTTSSMDMGAAGTYTIFHQDGEQVAGLMPMNGPEWPADMPAHWMPYVAVENVDETFARVETCGGEGCVPPTDIPNTGRFAVIEDGSGGFISIFQGA
jgi:predicted enzyme related to lactoylglutathione lyase